MSDSGTGAFRFPGAGNLDPRAQEFVPVNPITFHPTTQIRFSTHVYFPYTPTAPPPPPPHAADGGGVVTFFNFHPPPPPPTHGMHFPVTSSSSSSYFGFSPAPELPPPSTSPTRALAISSVPCDVSESTLRRDLEVFGDVRGVQMERAFEGIVTVHFYDLRAAETALREICGQHVQQQARLRCLSAWGSPPVPARGLVSRRAVWAQFVFPATCAVPGGCNQGTLVIFNLDPAISSSALRQIFEVYGPIRELRETPYKKHQRFVEFYDVRDASKALEQMNGREISGKKVMIEFSRPGGQKNKFRLSQPQPQPHPQPRPPPRLLSHSPPRPRPLLQSPVVSLRKKKKKLVFYSEDGNPINGSVEVSMRSLSINHHRQTGGTISGEGRSRNVNADSAARWGRRRHTKNVDAEFLISEETMEDSSCRDPRTTLMIKNIPNKYSQKLLLNMLDNHCIHFNEQIAGCGDESQPLSSYDFVYLPIDFNNKCNVGYGFVNMTSPEAARRLYKAFHLQRWEVFNSRKICHVTYARVQGLEALKEHFKSSKFPCEADPYLPVVFSPPRDGTQLTEPVPININGSHNHKQMDGQDGSTCEPFCANDHNDIHADTFSGSSIDCDDGSSTVDGDRSCFASCV